MKKSVIVENDYVNNEKKIAGFAVMETGNRIIQVWIKEYLT